MGNDPDPTRFFNSFPEFSETGEAGASLARLNARYQALIHENRDAIRGSRVLDLGCHDGRFSFAALMNGATHVVGIDTKDHLLRAGLDHFMARGISPDRCTFLLGDLYDCIESAGRVDVVFCFGILYHVSDHMELFSKIAAREPRTIIIDTRISTFADAVIELRSPVKAGLPVPGSKIEAQPSKLALEAMLSSFGWTFRHFDWVTSGLTPSPGTRDYADGRRITTVVTCPEHGVPQDVRSRAVEEVLDRSESRETQFFFVTDVARKHGVPREALRWWVYEAERSRWKEAGFSL